MNNDKTIMLIGGHDSGKTNFVMKFWLSLNQGKGRILKDGEPEHFEYIRTASEHLLSGKYAPHTPVGIHNRCILPIRWNIDSNSGRGILIVPDSYGEGWRKVFKSRSWSQEWEELISETCSALIFLRIDSEENVHPLDWISCIKLYGTPTKESDPNGGTQKETSIPTQVLLVEWIQFLRKAFSDRIRKSFRPRVGIIISAWDLAPFDQQNMDPRKWLKSNYPLLHQYLEANIDQFDFSVFAVSIVGFDLNKPEEGQMDQYLDNPYNSGYVVWSDSTGFHKDSDLTLPVAWSLHLC
jgi:hypothetical protein